MTHFEDGNVSFDRISCLLYRALEFQYMCRKYTIATAIVYVCVSYLMLQIFSSTKVSSFILKFFNIICNNMLKESSFPRLLFGLAG